MFSKLTQKVLGFTLKRKLVGKNFKKLPNLVTLEEVYLIASEQ